MGRGGKVRVSWGFSSDATPSPGGEHVQVGKRAILVWFHVLTSVGWMSLALCLATLLLWGRSNHDRSAVVNAT
jgi:hypothetical protein